MSNMPSSRTSLGPALDETAGSATKRDPTATTKRTDYISWEEYFMSLAALSAQRSKDPNRQVGAVIVNPDNRIVGIGYNGFPHGCDDDALPWAKVARDPLDTKYPYVCHAEVNAIMNSNQASLRDCVLFVTLFPCNECVKLILQARIAGVVYLGEGHKDSLAGAAARRMLDMAHVWYRPYRGDRTRFCVDLAEHVGRGAKTDVPKPVQACRL